MNVALRKSMTLDQFLAWEIRQELRYEFDGANPVAMNGVRVEHAIIESNLNAALRDRLKGRRAACATSSSSRTIAGAQVFARRGPEWTVETIKDDDILRLPEIYADVALAEDEADER